MSEHLPIPERCIADVVRETALWAKIGISCLGDKSQDPEIFMGHSDDTPCGPIAYFSGVYGGHKLVITIAPADDLL